MKDLNTDSCKICLKKIKEDRHRKDIPLVWIESFNIIKVALLPKVIYRVNLIPAKIPTASSTEMKKHPQIHMESHGTMNGQNNLEKRIQLE